MTSRLVVVSGLPASGKTTIGRLLGRRLSLPLIDKDAVLEALLDGLGSPEREERSRLNRLPETARGPLGLAPVVRVDTAGSVDADRLTAQVRSALATSATPSDRAIGPPGRTCL